MRPNGGGPLGIGLIKLDCKFQLASRRVLLAAHNCSVHAGYMDSKALVSATEHNGSTENNGLGGPAHDVTLLRALHMLVRAWNQVAATNFAKLLPLKWLLCGQ